jgi:hypothetical protein
MFHCCSPGGYFCIDTDLPSLAALTKDTATTATVTPIINQITTQLKTAISGVKASSDETVPLEDVTDLVTDILAVRNLHLFSRLSFKA